MMDILSRKLYVDSLFELYGVLLTDKQREIMFDYCHLDYTETEISELRGISRQAVHDFVKKATSALEKYEEKLGFQQKIRKYDALLDRIREALSLEEVKEVMGNGII